MDMNEQLSPHFKRREFSCKGCRNENRCPHGHGYGKGKAIIDAGTLAILEDVRMKWGKPVTVHSGYRCEQHNRRVRGATASQHLEGTAADFSVRGVSLQEVYDYLDPKVDGGLALYSSFIHVDTRMKRKRW